MTTELFNDGGFDNEEIDRGFLHGALFWITLLPILVLSLIEGLFRIVFANEGTDSTDDIYFFRRWTMWFRGEHINPFSTGNFAHAFAEHWDWNPDYTNTRWNYITEQEDTGT